MVGVKRGGNIVAYLIAENAICDFMFYTMYLCDSLTRNNFNMKFAGEFFIKFLERQEWFWLCE